MGGRSLLYLKSNLRLPCTYACLTLGARSGWGLSASASASASASVSVSAGGQLFTPESLTTEPSQLAKAVGSYESGSQ